MYSNYPVKFSVAMTTYNHEKYIATALDSILNQKHNYSYEIVVSDDCSTDNTRKIIEKYQKEFPDIVKPIFNEKNLGVSKTCINNFRSCKGEYIATLDGDDFWTDPEKIKKQITFLDLNPQYVISCHRYKRFYTETSKYEEDLHPELFIDNPDGFEFDQEHYFEKWLTQTLTMVFRNSALDNTPHFERNRYCWDTQIFWTVLNKGKGYIHNFFGGVYLIHSGGVWSQHVDQQKYSINFLSIEELYRDFHDNAHLTRIYNLYKKNLYWLKSEYRKPLNPKNLKNTSFTIISDDGWGEELYNYFNLPYSTPFIGTFIYNKDFVKLTSSFEYYINKPLKFINVSESRNIKDFRHTYGKAYPIGTLGDIEIHFKSYSNEDEVIQLWNERIKLIVWDNLYFKMDASYEEDNIHEINLFQSLPKTKKLCFLKFHDRNKLRNLINKDNFLIMDYWNPDSKIFFPYSLSNLDIITWLNEGTALYNKSVLNKNQIFSPIKKRQHFFVEFNTENILFLDSDINPNSYKIISEEDQVKILYNKSNDEYFRLSTQELTQPLDLDLYIDLSNKEDRHVMILVKGNTDAYLSLDIVVRDEKENEFCYKNLTKAKITEDYEWLHFDFTGLSIDSNPLLSRVKCFHFNINDGEKATGELELLAFYVGSMKKFEELIG